MSTHLWVSRSGLRSPHHCLIPTQLVIYIVSVFVRTPILSLPSSMSNFVPSPTDATSIATIRTLAADVVGKANSGHPGQFRCQDVNWKCPDVSGPL